MSVYIDRFDGHILELEQLNVDSKTTYIIQKSSSQQSKTKFSNVLKES